MSIVIDYTKGFFEPSPAVRHRLDGLERQHHDT